MIYILNIRSPVGWYTNHAYLSRQFLILNHASFLASYTIACPFFASNFHFQINAFTVQGTILVTQSIVENINKITLLAVEKCKQKTHAT